MTLTLSIAKESDATRISDIHMAAFSTNMMLLAQFPTPAVRDGLRVSLVEKVIEEMRDPKWVVLVVRDQNEKVIGFAKWCLPILESETYDEVPWRWPDGTNMKVLDEWSEKVDNAAGKVIGNIPCYRLSFTATDPLYERRGAASLMIQWGLERSRRHNIPVALESTMNALPLYKKHGFKAEEDISLVLEGMGTDGTSVLYEEKSCIFSPNVRDSTSEPTTQPSN